MNWQIISSQTLTILGHALVVIIPYAGGISSVKIEFHPISTYRKIKYYAVWLLITAIASLLITKDIKELDNWSGLLSYFIPAYMAAILGIREGIAKDKRMNRDERIVKMKQDLVSEMKANNHSDDKY